MNKTTIITNSTCPNYSRGKNPMIELIDFPSGKRLCQAAPLTTICFLTKGAFTAKLHSEEVFEFEAGNMFLIPAGRSYRIEFTKNSHFMIFRIKFAAHFCENYNLKAFVEHQPHKVESTYAFKRLEIRSRLSQYLDLQEGILCDGLRCKLFMEMKAKELFLLLKAYYTPEELGVFFAPLLREDFDFYNKVMTNWMNVSNIEQLAEICHFSVSGFTKHFKKMFGE